MSHIHAGLDNDPWGTTQTGAEITDLDPGRCPVERILCPIDFSDTSRAALRYAATLARWYGAEIRALHVVGVPSASGDVELSRADARTARANARVHWRQRLREFLEPVEATGVRTKIDVQEGGTVDRIVECATTSGADLIVMGVHAGGGIGRRLFGSTTEAVVHAASCPVLTVRAA